MTNKTVVIDTPQGIEYARLAALKGRLSLEIKGMRFKGRPTGVILREMGFKGKRREALLKEVEAELERRMKDRDPA